MYAVVQDGCTPLAVSRYLTKAFVWDRCHRGDSASFVEHMTLIADLIGTRAVVFPMDDLSAVSIAENSASLAERFVLTPVPSHLPTRLANKLELSALCAELGIPTAVGISPKCFDSVKEFAEHSRFPVVLKAAEQWHPVNHAFCTKVIETREELFAICEHYDYLDSGPLLLQEHIPGEDWIAHGYYNSEKDISLTFTGRKICGYPNGAGSTAMGLSVENAMLRLQSEKLLKSIGYSGIIDMDWRLDSRDGQYRLLDCNPRVGQNFRMFETNLGLDVALAQYLDLSGNQIDAAPQIDGRLFIVESFYVLSLLRRLTRFAGSREKIIRPPHQETELAWWSTDDIVPFFFMIVRVAARLIGRSVRMLFSAPLRSWFSELQGGKNEGLVTPGGRPAHFPGLKRQ